MASDDNKGAAPNICIEAAQMTIQRLPLLEDWPGPWEKWAKSYSQRHLWRIANVVGNDVDDAISECALVYVECRLRYGTKIQSPAHFMALYKLCVASWFNTLARMDEKIRIANDHQLLLEEPMEELEETVDFRMKMEVATSEIRDIVNIFCNTPAEFMDVLRQETMSHNSKAFFGTVLRHLGITKNRTEPLMNELRSFLTR